MFKFFDRIREKPKHVRDNYALLFAGVFSLLALALWLLTLSQSTTNETVSDLDKNSESSTEAPFSTLFTEIKSQWKTVKDSFQEVKKEPEEVSTPEEENASTTPTVDMEAAFNFATSSKPKTAPQPPKDKGETILIATSTATTSRPTVSP